MMRRYFLIFSGIFALIVFVVAAAIFIITKGRGTPTDTPLPPPEGEISVHGTFLCLPHKNTLGPQTLECAFGLKDGEGRYYGLADSRNDYAELAGTPVNTEVDVTGNFTPQTDLKYPTVGIIFVAKISESSGK